MYSKGNDGHYCPICGQKVNSVSRYSQTTQFMAKTGGKFAGKQVGKYIGYAVGSVVGLGEVGGLLLGFAGGQIAEAAISESFNNAQTINCCPGCGIKWDPKYNVQQVIATARQYKNDDENIPFPPAFSATVISAILTVLCFLYCHYNDYKTYSHTEESWLFGETKVYDWHYSWYFVGFLMIIFLIITIVGFSITTRQYEHYLRGREIAKMTLGNYVTFNHDKINEALTQ